MVVPAMPAARHCVNLLTLGFSRREATRWQDVVRRQHCCQTLAVEKGHLCRQPVLFPGNLSQLGQLPSPQTFPDLRPMAIEKEAQLQKA